jgi:hypothetical protein
MVDDLRDSIAFMAIPGWLRVSDMLERSVCRFTGEGVNPCAKSEVLSPWDLNI